MQTPQTSLQDILATWPDERRELAASLIGRYGEPQEATGSRLLWFENHPWKHTTLFKVGAEHAFPAPHFDVLEQVIDYRVPPEKACELLRFDGSLTIRRTRGELSAFCTDEGVNFLSINLADEIVTGRTDVSGARRQFGENLAMLRRNEISPLTQGFTFSVMKGGTADPDRPP